MRITIIATCGIALLWASSVRAQESGCPDLPPTSARSSELSVTANASLLGKVLGKVLSAVGLEFAGETTVDDLISRYPNPDQLFFQTQYIVLQCLLIMKDTELDTAKKKREAMRGIFHDALMLRLSPSPSPIPSSTPVPKAPHIGLSPAEAAAVAEQIAQLDTLGTYGVDDLLKNLSVPFCGDQNVYRTATALRSALQENRGPDYQGFSARVVDVRTVGDYLADIRVLLSQPGNFARFNTIKRCIVEMDRFGLHDIVSRDYIIGILMVAVCGQL
jgi:hypothetical protein